MLVEIYLVFKHVYLHTYLYTNKSYYKRCTNYNVKIFLKFHKQTSVNLQKQIFKSFHFI